MALNFEVVAKTPATAKAVGIPVRAKVHCRKKVTLSRATLETLGFTGKVGQTYVVPAEKGAASILIGVGEVSKLTRHRCAKHQQRLLVQQQVLNR
jgi:hypothetical protein